MARKTRKGIGLVDPWVIPLAALMVSLVTFISSQYSQSKTAKQNFADSLEKRLSLAENEILSLKKEVIKCESEKTELHKRLFELMSENRDLRKRFCDSDLERIGK